MKFRLLIEDKPRKAVENMAIDKALMELCEQPVLRLYTWKPAAVSIGRFQSLRDEVDLDYCKNNGVEFVRRITGGGAVFHDDEITYSITIKEGNKVIPDDLTLSYKKICECVMKGLERLGMKAEYVPINDIIVNGKKISGCAQTRRNKTLLQHGTLLMKTDVDKMFSILKVPNEKIKDKLISDVKQRVTSITNEMGKDMHVKEVMEKITEGFKKVLGVEFDISELTDKEKELAANFEKEIFGNDEWSFQR